VVLDGGLQRRDGDPRVHRPADRIDVDVARPGIQDGGQVDEPAWSLSVVTTLRRRRFGCRLRSRIKRQSFLLFTTTPWWRGAALTRRYP